MIHQIKIQWLSGLYPDLSRSNGMGNDGKAEIVDQDKPKDCG